MTFLSGIRENVTTKIYVLVRNAGQPGEQSVLFSSKLKIDLVNVYPVETVQLSPDEQREAPLFLSDARKVHWCTRIPVNLDS